MRCYQITPKSQWLRTTRPISAHAFVCCSFVGQECLGGSAHWGNSRTNVAIHKHRWPPYRGQEFQSVSQQLISTLTCRWHIPLLTAHWLEPVTWHNPWGIRYWAKGEKWVIQYVRKRWVWWRKKTDQVRKIGCVGEWERREGQGECDFSAKT